MRRNFGNLVAQKPDYNLAALRRAAKNLTFSCLIIRGKHTRMAEEQDGRRTSTKTRDTNGPRRSSTKAGGPGEGSTKAGRFDDTKGQDKARKKTRGFDEGYMKAGGSTKATRAGRGVRRRPRVSTKAKGVRRPLPKAVCHPPPYAVLIGLPLILRNPTNPKRVRI